MTDTYTGICRYCGKVQIVSGEHVTDQNVDEYAAANCTCDEAKAVKKTIEAMRRAEDVLEGDGYDARSDEKNGAEMEYVGGHVREALIALTQQIAAGNVDKLSIVLHDGTCFKVFNGRAGITITRKAALERLPRLKAAMPLTADEMAGYMRRINARPEV